MNQIAPTDTPKISGKDVAHLSGQLVDLLRLRTNPIGMKHFTDLDEMNAI